MKKILDSTCGARSIWFDKTNQETVYCDIRNEQHAQRFGSAGYERHLHIQPDVICDFTDLPFDDESFYLVVFDPPHLLNLSKEAWLRKAYGSLDDNWSILIKRGFDECMRVLKTNGTLVFKWADTSIATPDLIKAVGETPLFGHRSGKKMNTHWLCFMKT